MDAEVFDCIVVGLGAHGSSCIAKLAKEGCKVLGLEKFTRVHNQGSSHGRSRVIRQAYFEDPRYVPLVKRSFALWRELADFEEHHRKQTVASHITHHLTENGSQDDPSPFSPPRLLNMCGGLMIGPKQSAIISGTLESVRRHKLSHEVLTAKEIRERYPMLTPGDDLMGVFEEEAGYLIPEACLEAHLKEAEQNGGVLRFNESLVSWEKVKRSNGGEGEGEWGCSGDLEELITVVSDLNKCYLTKKLVLSVGAWAPELYGGQIPVPLRTERRVLFWLRPSPSQGNNDGNMNIDAFRGMPVFLWDNSIEGNCCQFYGFPPESTGEQRGHTVKIARHQAIEVEESNIPETNSRIDSVFAPAVCSPESIDREVYPAEVSFMLKLLEGKVPTLARGAVETVETCLYTITPDEHFLIDFHPDNRNVILASPCSGHGFKFSSVIGEILTDLVMRGETQHDIALFSFSSREV